MRCAILFAFILAALPALVLSQVAADCNCQPVATTDGGDDMTTDDGDFSTTFDDFGTSTAFGDDSTLTDGSLNRRQQSLTITAGNTVSGFCSCPAGQTPADGQTATTSSTSSTSLITSRPITTTSSSTSRTSTGTALAGTNAGSTLALQGSSIGYSLIAMLVGSVLGIWIL